MTANTNGLQNFSANSGASNCSMQWRGNTLMFKSQLAQPPNPEAQSKKKTTQPNLAKKNKNEILVAPSPHPGLHTISFFSAVGTRGILPPPRPPKPGLPVQSWWSPPHVAGLPTKNFDPPHHPRLLLGFPFSPGTTCVSP